MRPLLTLLSLLLACGGGQSPRVPTVELSEPLPHAPVVTKEPALAVNADIDGSWSEQWGVPGQTDINYHDVYVIQSSGDKLAITCAERPKYVFESVLLAGRHLTVALQNGDVHIDYDLDLDWPATSSSVTRGPPRRSS